VNGLRTWCAAMYRELVTILTGVIALVLWLLPLLFPSLERASRSLACVALSIGFMWASVRTWYGQNQRCVGLQKLLAEEYVPKIQKHRRQLSAAAIRWDSPQHEEDYYVSKFDDVESAKLAFRLWKERRDKQPVISPAIAVGESGWIRKTKSLLSDFRW
jgi:hypothetical protein